MSVRLLWLRTSCGLVCSLLLTSTVMVLALLSNEIASSKQSQEKGVRTLKSVGSRYFTEVSELPPLDLVSTSEPNQRPDHDQSSLVLPYSKSSARRLLPVTYTNDPKSVYTWYCDNLPRSGCTIGFDVELVPNLPWMKRTSFYGPATVQLATPDSCLVVHLVRRSGRRSQACAPILKAVLCDELFVKAGCALDEDMLSLYELWGGLDARSRLDLSGLGRSSVDGRRNPRRGLKALSKIILGVDLPKPKTQAMSNWSQVPLSESQIAYGARDAWAGAAIVRRLSEHDPSTFGNQNLVRLLVSSESPTSTLMKRKKRRQRAKKDLGKLLLPYKATSSSSNATKVGSLPVAKRLPQSVAAKVRTLRGVIKTRTIDYPRLIEVDHLGFDFDDLDQM